MKKLLWLLMFVGYTDLAGMGRGMHAVPPGSYLLPEQCGGSCTMIRGRIECTACAISPQERVTKQLFNPETCPVEGGRFDIVNDSDRTMLKCLPRGSYLQSCGNCRMENDDLICQGCYIRTGEPLQLLNDETRLNLSSCRYDIVNNNGRLRCLPEGQYLDHCDCVIANGVLQCKCTANGQTQAIGMQNVDQCKPDSITYDGQKLRCTAKKQK